jgi:Fe2+ transport system protein FeoA
MGLQPGDRIEVVRKGDRIELIPVRAMQTGLGFLPGLDTTVERDGDRI